VLKSATSGNPAKNFAGFAKNGQIPAILAGVWAEIQYSA